IGCGRGNHCFELAARFGCRTIGVDVVLQPVQTTIASRERNPLVQFVQGRIEELPMRAESIDFVWCRDMLVHIERLEPALQECHRILRCGGNMLAWVTRQTDLMEPREADRLYSRLGIEAGSISQERLETSFARAGLTVRRTETLGSELMEFYQERDGRACRELMRIARMRRMREQLIAEWGETRYETVHALYHWIVYHLLGKLSSALYLLGKS